MTATGIHSGGSPNETHLEATHRGGGAANGIHSGASARWYRKIRGGLRVFLLICGGVHPYPGPMLSEIVPCDLWQAFAEIDTQPDLYTEPWPTFPTAATTLVDYDEAWVTTDDLRQFVGPTDDCFCLHQLISKTSRFLKAWGSVRGGVASRNYDEAVDGVPVQPTSYYVLKHQKDLWEAMQDARDDPCSFWPRYHRNTLRLLARMYFALACTTETAVTVRGWVRDLCEEGLEPKPPAVDTYQGSSQGEFGQPMASLALALNGSH